MLEQSVLEPPVRSRARVTHVTVSACLHGRRRIVGIDESADYYQCDECGETLAEMGGILWHVRPSLIPS